MLKGAESIVALVVGIVGFLRDLLSWKRSAEDRQAGRDEVTATTNAAANAQVAKANKAANAASQDHATKSDDSAFDQDFKRKD